MFSSEFDEETWFESPKTASMFETDQNGDYFSRLSRTSKNYEFTLDVDGTKDDPVESAYSIKANSASDAYISHSLLAHDDGMRVDPLGMDLEMLDGAQCYSNGRMDQEDFLHYFEPANFASDSDSKEEPSKSRPVLAPDSLDLRKPRDSAEYFLRLIYEQNQLFDLEDIADQTVRDSMLMILPLLFHNFDPADPLKPDQIQGCNRKVKLMVFMRKDQYVKKAWSKLKTVLYSKFKNPKTLKTNAQEQLKEELAFNHKQAFENLFGSSTCDGLKVESIEYILSNDSTFSKIFETTFFKKLREELNLQTLHDIEINFLKKLDPFLSGEQGGWEKSKEKLRKDRAVKTPFTYLENNTALVVLVDQFIKQLKKTTVVSEAKKVSLSTRLTSLRKYLVEFAETRKWTLPGCKFKKSEIVSFLC